MIKDHLESIIRPLLSKPDALLVTQSEDTLGTLLSISIEKLDMGRLIGKKGETIAAVRSLIHTLGNQQGIRVSVKLLEPELKRK